MAIASTYNTGTASINAGETAVTGQGTTWLTSGIRAGDLFWAAGLAIRIAAVNSNTSLTLAYAWPGSTRAAAAYEIRYTPDAERVLASTREMLTALGANAISPLVGLVPAADKGIYYTGAGTAALFDLTAFARSLLDDANAAAFWTTIGTTAPADKAFRRGNVLASVAQAAGVPTGGLIERGSNANGEYVRFADGTQICTAFVTLTYVGSTLLSFSWTYPAAFVAIPMVHKSLVAGGLPFDISVVKDHVANMAPTSGRIDAWAPGGTFSSGHTCTARVTAIGRWF